MISELPHEMEGSVTKLAVEIMVHDLVVIEIVDQLQMRRTPVGAAPHSARCPMRLRSIQVSVAEQVDQAGEVAADGDNGPTGEIMNAVAPHKCRAALVYHRSAVKGFGS